MCDMLQDPVNSASSQQLKLRESSFWGDDPILKKIVNENQTDWDLKLHSAL